MKGRLFMMLAVLVVGLLVMGGGRVASAQAPDGASHERVQRQRAPAACPPDIEWGCVLSGSTSPGLTLNSSATASNSYSLYASLNNPGTASAAVWGRVLGSGSSGYGVYGSHQGSGYGVYGFSNNGIGFLGYSNTNVGMQGETNSTGDSPGILGLHRATSGTGAGVEGRTNSTSQGAVGVRATGGTYGVYATGTAEGVYATSGQNAIEALGTGYSATIYASNEANSWAIYGVTTTDYDGNAAVTGANLSQGYGVMGQSGTSSGDGVYGTGNTGVRGVGAANGEGVIGRADGSLGWGVWGASAAGRGIYGSTTSGWAGYFAGNVYINGDLDVTGATTGALMDHPMDPANQYLRHATIQSSETLNLYTGNVLLNEKGEAEVVLPAWFTAVNRDFRYQLTAVGAPGPNLYVARKVENNRFVIAGGAPGMEVSWEVTAVRGDPYARDHAFQAEVSKPESERGTYLYPEGYGQPRSRGVDAADAAREAENARPTTRPQEGLPQGDRSGPAPEGSR